MATIHFNSSSSSGPFGKLLTSLFFLAFLAAGCFFLYMLGTHMRDVVASYTWPAVPCQIMSSEVVDTRSSEDPYRFEVEFGFHFKGHDYYSKTLTLGEESFSDYADAQKLVSRYAPGSTHAAYVNPRWPGRQAMLKRPSLWQGLFLLLPLVFILIGGAGIYATWSGDKPKPKRPISRGAVSGGYKFLYGFLSIFVIVGLGMFHAMFVYPVTQIMQARSWEEVPCEVISSRVQRHESEDDEGRTHFTYSVDVLYSYQFDGREFKSNRYDFFSGSTSGREAKAEIVRSYPRGSSCNCHVDPHEPSQAVLNREFTADGWFGLLPLLFVGGGGLGIWGTRRKQKRQQALKAKLSGEAPELPHAGPVVLKATSARIGRLVGIVFFTVFWNGIVSLFLMQVVEGFEKGRPDWFLTLFMIPFVLCGLFVVGLVFYYFLALFNPMPILTLSSRAPALGAGLEIGWRIRGRAGKIGRFRIYLKGEERATYQRGTSSYTDTNTFAEIDVVDQPSAPAAGSARLSIPADTMHSFEADNNEIRWELCVDGDVERWPNVEEKYRLTVVPARNGGIA